jgi:hypothetical protein
MPLRRPSGEFSHSSLVTVSVPGTGLRMTLVRSGRAGTWIALVGVTVACVGHLWVIVSYGVTATSGLPDDELGLATGLITSFRQVGITMGIPLLSALAANRPHLIDGVRLALGTDAVVVAVVTVPVAVGLHRGAVAAARAALA